jgi:hypothetical protein
MKRLVLLAMLAILGIALSAQDVVLRGSQTYAKYRGVATDVIDAAENLDKIFVINKDYWYNYIMVVDIDTNTDATDETLSCLLQGSYDNTNYTTITDVTFYVSDDTVITYSNNTILTEAGTNSIAAYIITDTLAAFNMFISDSTFEDETVAGEDTISVAEQVHDIDVAAQTQTWANTVTAGGVMYQYLRFRLTGDGAEAEAELQSIDLKIVRAE